MSSRATVFSGTKDGSIKVERVFVGVVTERFIVGPKRDCPTFKGQTFEKFPEWKKMAISYLQTERTNNPIFFHVEGPIYDFGSVDVPVTDDPMGWYYWDETWSSYHGPFPSYETAQANLILYCEWLNGKEPPRALKAFVENVGPIVPALGAAFSLAAVEAATVALDEMAAKIVSVPPLYSLCGGATVDLGTAKDVVATFPDGHSVVVPDGKVAYCAACTHHPISEYLT